MIEVRDNPAERRYEIYDGGELAGFTIRDHGDGVVTFVHTEIGETHAGKGLAKKLVAAALADVRAQGLGVLPDCPLVRKVIADNPAEYLDLVPAGARARYDLPPA